MSARQPELAYQCGIIDRAAFRVHSRISIYTFRCLGFIHSKNQAPSITTFVI